MAATAKPKSNREVAQTVNCEAKGGFRDKSGNPDGCVKCACQKDPPECTLYNYRPNCCKLQKPKKTPHHVIPARCFMPPNQRGVPVAERETYVPGFNLAKAPCICVKGAARVKKHGQLHDSFDSAEQEYSDKKMHAKHVPGTWTYEEAREAAAQSVLDAFGDDPKCSEKCIKEQLDAYYKKPPCSMTNKTLLRADPSGKKPPSPLLVSSTPSSESAAG